jgi:hypothetical protein
MSIKTGAIVKFGIIIKSESISQNRSWLYGHEFLLSTISGQTGYDIVNSHSC